MLSRDSLLVLLQWFEGLSESVKLWSNFFENHSDFSNNSLGFGSDTIEKQGVINLSSNGYSYACIVLHDSEVTFPKGREGCNLSSIRFYTRNGANNTCNDTAPTMNWYILTGPNMNVITHTVVSRYEILLPLTLFHSSCETREIE